MGAGGTGEYGGVGFHANAVWREAFRAISVLGSHPTGIGFACDRFSEAA